MLNSPELREKLATLGCEPSAGTPEQFAARIRSNLPRWASVVKEAGVGVD
ncbi:hypothetical protein QTH90_29175 [Variovorax sp. J2P1-59]|nr:hypothetical protein [Variovorax sp. J2P1-59]MDM0078512.1 hypothetical protein [Variovorax sp. J2P1-59]